MKKTLLDLSMNLLNKLTLVFVATLLCSCAMAQDLNIRRGGGGGTGTVDTNNFGVNGFINYGYTKDVIKNVGVDSYDITTNDTTISYIGPVGGELQLPDPATCNGRWLNIVNTSGFDLSLVCADRVIIAPDYTGSGTLQIVMPTGRSVTLLAVDDETWWETASQATAGGGGSGTATNVVLPVLEGFLNDKQVIDLSVYQYQYYTNTAPTNNLSISFTNAVVGKAVQVYITGRQGDAITNINYNWPGEARWFTWTNTYVSTNKVLALSITPLRTNLLHVAGKEDAR